MQKIYYESFKTQIDEDGKFVERHIWFMKNFPFVQQGLYLKLTDLVKAKIPIKVFQVIGDAYVDVPTTSVFFEQKLQIDTELLQNTRHEVFTLTPSKIADFIRKYEEKTKILKFDTDW